MERGSWLALLGDDRLSSRPALSREIVLSAPFSFGSTGFPTRSAPDAIVRPTMRLGGILSAFSSGQPAPPGGERWVRLVEWCRLLHVAYTPLFVVALPVLQTSSSARVVRPDGGSHS